MSITFDSDTSITKATSACDRPSQNEVVVLYSQTSDTVFKVRRYTTAAGHAQQGSDVTLTNTGTPKGRQVAMVSDDIAIVSGTGELNPQRHWLVNLVSSTVVEVGASAQSAFATRPGMLVGNRAGQAMLLVDDQTKIVKFTTSSATTITFPAYLRTSEAPSTICVNTDTNNFIVGTNMGRIIELHATTDAVIKETTIPQEVGIYGFTGSTYGGNHILSMSYAYGLLIVQTTNSQIYLLDYATGKVLAQRVSGDSNPSTYTSTGTWAFSPADGTCVVMFMANSSNQLGAGMTVLDLAMPNLPDNGIFYNTNSGQYINAGIQGTHAWVMTTSNVIHWATVSSRRTTVDKTVSLTIGGTPTAGEVFVIDSSDKLILNVPFSESGRVIPVTSGESLIVVVKTLEGLNSKFEVHTAST
jgi:hypothetical protein